MEELDAEAVVYFTQYSPRISLLSHEPPMRYAHRGWLWFTSQVLYFLLQPNADMRLRISQERARIAARWNQEEVWDGRPIAAVHVRHGDKSTEVRGFSLGAYMDAVDRFRDANPDLRTVLLSTEDQSVIDATSQFPDYTFIYTDYPRLNGVIEDDIRTGKLNGRGEATNALLNLYLAVLECDYLVATFSSNWGRLLLKMMYAAGRKRRSGGSSDLPRYTSLDAWSHDVSMRLDSNTAHEVMGG
jgi:hypothetical protein